jgi:hypothetical protein
MARDPWPVKAQTIRVLDVALIGPLMIWGGLKVREDNPTAGTALAAFGVSTIVYNAVNYGRIQEQQRAQKALAWAPRGSRLSKPV